MTRRWPRRRQDQKQAVGLRPAAFSLPAIRCRMSLCVFGFVETALVNQAPARSAPGLGPSGFDPHAFARSGLRAPLAPGQRASSSLYRTIQRIAGSPAPSWRCNGPRPGEPRSLWPLTGPARWVIFHVLAIAGETTEFGKNRTVSPRLSSLGHRKC